jgi:hypothetical protein
MSNIMKPEATCLHTLRYLDVHMNNELPADLAREVSRHLGTCAKCSAELELRNRILAGLKRSSEPMPSSYLQGRIINTIRAKEARPRWYGWQRQLSAAAIVLFVAGGTFVAYQLSNLRMTTASQNSFIEALSKGTAHIMNAGLQDHLHCSVFRKYPKSAPSLEQLRERLPEKYRSLIPVLQSQVPAEFKIYISHECGYKGRRFIHLGLKKDSRLMSLVIAVKEPGESFETSELAPVLSQAGTKLYGASVQRFQISGFETGEHLAYLVSDLPREQNMRLMLALAPGVRQVLESVKA